MQGARTPYTGEVIESHGAARDWIECCPAEAYLLRQEPADLTLCVNVNHGVFALTLANPDREGLTTRV